MFSQTERYYDKIYAWKEYEAETQRIVAVVQQRLSPDAAEKPRLLDVACGTGHHVAYLKTHFDVEGLDLSEGLLEVARQRNPEIPFHCADMIDFDLGRAYEVITCLFSSIGYVKTTDNLARAIGSMARHLAPGGLLIVEPWFTPGNWHPHTVHASFVDEPELKIARVSTSLVEGRLSYFYMHYLIGTPEGTEHLVERHELGLFEVDEMRAAFAAAGLEVTYDPEGITGRGLYIASHPSQR